MEFNFFETPVFYSSFVFHVTFTPLMVFTHIYMFPVVISLTELAKQHITRCVKVIPKLPDFVFWEQ